MFLVTLRKPDMVYAGRVIRAYVKARYGGPYKMAEKLADPPSTSTFYAITAGRRYSAEDPLVTGLELSFDWPVGTVEALAVQDFDGMAEVGAPDALVTLAKRAAQEGRKVQGERRTSNRAGS